MSTVMTTWPLTSRLLQSRHIASERACVPIARRFSGENVSLNLKRVIDASYHIIYSFRCFIKILFGERETRKMSRHQVVNQSINQSITTPEGSAVKIIAKSTYKLIWKIKKAKNYKNANTQINRQCFFSRLWRQQNVSTCFPLSSQSKLINYGLNWIPGCLWTAVHYGEVVQWTYIGNFDDDKLSSRHVTQLNLMRAFNNNNNNRRATACSCVY